MTEPEHYVLMMLFWDRGEAIRWLCADGTSFSGVADARDLLKFPSAEAAVLTAKMLGLKNWRIYRVRENHVYTLDTRYDRL